MPTMIELEAEFLRIERRDGKEFWKTVPTKAEAHGVRFLCPKCFKDNSGAGSAHSVICWSRSAGAPEDARPGPGRWKMVGDGIADLTLDADPPGTARSVLLSGGCDWHGFVNAGVAE